MIQFSKNSKTNDPQFILVRTALNILGKLVLNHSNVCPRYKNNQWRSILEFTFFYIDHLQMSLTISPMTFSQYYNSTLFYCITHFEHYSADHASGFMETLVPCKVLIIKMHQHAPFTMAIILSLSSRRTLPSSHHVTYNA